MASPALPGLDLRCTDACSPALLPCARLPPANHSAPTRPPGRPPAGQRFVPFSLDDQRTLIKALREVLLKDVGPAAVQYYKEFYPDPAAPSGLVDVLPSVDVWVTVWEVVAEADVLGNQTYEPSLPVWQSRMQALSSFLVAQGKQLQRAGRRSASGRPQCTWRSWPGNLVGSWGVARPGAGPRGSFAAHWPSLYCGAGAVAVENQPQVVLSYFSLEWLQGGYIQHPVTSMIARMDVTLAAGAAGPAMPAERQSAVASAVEAAVLARRIGTLVQLVGRRTLDSNSEVRQEGRACCPEGLFPRALLN